MFLDLAITIDSVTFTVRNPNALPKWPPARPTAGPIFNETSFRLANTMGGDGGGNVAGIRELAGSLKDDIVYK